jgi:hypothetical protein
MKYEYTFVPWPDETRDFPRSLFDLFRFLGCRRCEMVFTEEEFGRFRSDLAGVGITLREAGRRPYVGRESVG